jgi:hypothetical protein
MYDLPKGFSFGFLKDQELELLCFGPYTVTLHFTQGIQIQIEGSFRHIFGGHGAHDVALSHFPLLDSKLMRLLAQRVAQAKAKRDGTLTLHFENGDSLVIDGNVAPYESYHVNVPGRGLLVV